MCPQYVPQKGATLLTLLAKWLPSCVAWGEAGSSKKYSWRKAKIILVVFQTEYKYCYDLVLHYVLHYLHKDIEHEEEWRERGIKENQNNPFYKKNHFRKKQNKLFSIRAFFNKNQPDVSNFFWWNNLLPTTRLFNKFLKRLFLFLIHLASCVHHVLHWLKYQSTAN